MPKFKRGTGISQSSAKISLKRARIRGSQRSTSKNFVKETENGKKGLRNEKKEQSTSPVIAYESLS